MRPITARPQVPREGDAILEQYNETTSRMLKLARSDLAWFSTTGSGASCALIAFLMREIVRENGKGTLSEVLTKEQHDEEEWEEDEDGDEGGGEQIEGAKSPHLIIGDPRPELPTGRPPRWLPPMTNDPAADDQSGNQVPEGWPPGWVPPGWPPGWVQTGWPPGWPPESRFDGEDEGILRSGKREPPVADDQSGDRQGSKEHDDDQDVEGQQYRGAVETLPQRLTLTPGGQRKRERGPPTSPTKQGQADAKSPTVAVEGFVHRKGGLPEKIQVIRPRQRETGTPPNLRSIVRKQDAVQEVEGYCREAQERRRKQRRQRRSTERRREQRRQRQQRRHHAGWRRRERRQQRRHHAGRRRQERRRKRRHRAGRRRQEQRRKQQWLRRHSA